MLGAELAHLRHSQRHGSARLMFWLLLLTLGASVGLGLALYLMGRSGGPAVGDIPLRYQTFSDYQDFANMLLVITILTSGPVLILEALLLSSDSINRERRSGTWDTLVLTPLSAWQIVTGKWRAGQSYVYRHYGGILLLRTIAFVWLGLSSGLEGQDALGLLLGVAAVAGFMALNLALASATSLLASFQSWPVATFGLAVGLQFVLALGIAAANVIAFRPLFDATGHGLEGAITMALMPAESGVIFASQFMAQPELDVTLTLSIFALANAALMIALTLGLLRAATRLAVRYGAAA